MPAHSIHSQRVCSLYVLEDLQKKSTNTWRVRRNTQDLSPSVAPRQPTTWRANRVTSNPPKGSRKKKSAKQPLILRERSCKYLPLIRQLRLRERESTNLQEWARKLSLNHARSLSPNSKLLPLKCRSCISV